MRESETEETPNVRGENLRIGAHRPRQNKEWLRSGQPWLPIGLKDEFNVLLPAQCQVLCDP